MIQREPYARIWRDLSAEKNLVLMAGPRQCGKTTLAKMIAGSFTNALYFNWDVPGSKARLVQDPFFFQDLLRKDDSTPLIVLDELHKYKDWKNYLKGVYDRFHEDYCFLVSGSGRLDIFHKGGDSLAGRYRLFHLWPFTLAELAGQSSSIEDFRENPLQLHLQDSERLQRVWKTLETFSGFPEPYVAASSRTYTRWARIYHQQLIREDIRSLTDIRTVDDLEILFALLPSKIGVPLSITGLAQNLKVAYNTVKNWLTAFERFFLTFSILPWTGSITRSVHKEKKLYLFNYALVPDSGARFENMVAVELLRAISCWNDMGYGNYALHFIRTKEQHEVDFVITEGRRPILLVETKRSDYDVAPNLKRFQDALRIPAVQLVCEGSGHKMLDNHGQRLLVALAFQWLPKLP